jgi:hypothetical protein
MELHAQIACRLPDKVEIIDAGPMAELVYYRACLRCREYLTDGVIARAHLTRWFAGIAHPTKHLARLVDVGLLEPHADGWQFPDDVWRRWIPTRAAVQAKREAEAERLRAYREQKRAEREAYDERTNVRGADVRGAYKQPEPLARATSQSQSHKPSPSRYLRPPSGEVGELIKGLFNTVDEEAS